MLVTHGGEWDNAIKYMCLLWPKVRGEMMALIRSHKYA